MARVWPQRGSGDSERGSPYIRRTLESEPDRSRLTSGLEAVRVRAGLVTTSAAALV